MSRVHGCLSFSRTFGELKFEFERTAWSKPTKPLYHRKDIFLIDAHRESKHTVTVALVLRLPYRHTHIPRVSLQMCDMYFMTQLMITVEQNCTVDARIVSDQSSAKFAWPLALSRVPRPILINILSLSRREHFKCCSHYASVIEQDHTGHVTLSRFCNLHRSLLQPGQGPCQECPIVPHNEQLSICFTTRVFDSIIRCEYLACQSRPNTATKTLYLAILQILSMYLYPALCKVYSHM